MEVYHKVPHYASLQPAACFSALQLCLQRKPVLKKGTAAGDRQPRKGGCSDGLERVCRKEGFQGGPPPTGAAGNLSFISLPPEGGLFIGASHLRTLFFI